MVCKTGYLSRINCRFPSDIWFITGKRPMTKAARSGWSCKICANWLENSSGLPPFWLFNKNNGISYFRKISGPSLQIGSLNIATCWSSPSRTLIVGFPLPCFQLSCNGRIEPRIGWPGSTRLQFKRMVADCFKKRPTLIFLLLIHFKGRIGKTVESR